MPDREPFLVENAGACMDCGERPARIAVPGPSGSTWLLCLHCSTRRVSDDLEALIAQLGAEPTDA